MMLKVRQNFKYFWRKAIGPLKVKQMNENLIFTKPMPEMLLLLNLRIRQGHIFGNMTCNTYAL